MRSDLRIDGQEVEREALEATRWERGEQKNVFSTMFKDIRREMQSQASAASELIVSVPAPAPQCRVPKTPARN